MGFQHYHLLTPFGGTYSKPLVKGLQPALPSSNPFRGLEDGNAGGGNAGQQALASKGILKEILELLHRRIAR